jgi:hypothetical protein
MEPIKFEHANQQLSGGNGGSLPVNKFEHDGHTYQLSIWRASIVERLAVLFTGRVQLMVRAEKHPVVAVAAGFGVREYDTRPTPHKKWLEFKNKNGVAYMPEYLRKSVFLAFCAGAEAVEHRLQTDATPVKARVRKVTRPSILIHSDDLPRREGGKITEKEK